MKSHPEDRGEWITIDGARTNTLRGVSVRVSW